MKIALTGHRNKFFPEVEGSTGDFVSNVTYNLKKAYQLIQPELVITGCCEGMDIIGGQVAIDEGFDAIYKNRQN